MGFLMYCNKGKNGSRFLKSAVFCILAIQANATTAVFCQGQSQMPTFDTSIDHYTIPIKREVMGGNYRPGAIELEPELADWDLLGFDFSNFYKNEFIVRSTRFCGFGHYFNGRCLDWSTTNASVLKNVRCGLHKGYVRRPCVSDLSKERGQVGPGGHLGVLVIKSERAPLVIGVSQVGFYLGCFHGTTHQEFYSWVLAKTVDEQLFKLSGKHLEEETFSHLSGEDFVKKGKAFFEDVQETR
jgi:hypothetical protein